MLYWNIRNCWNLYHHFFIFKNGEVKTNNTVSFKKIF